jgi:hypothetical protein
MFLIFRLKITERSSKDLGSCAISKTKRELPPLKRAKSNKKLEEMIFEGKQNLLSN